MRRPTVDNIEIIEPPIEELTKRHSGFRRTCLTGCGCIVLFIVGGIVAVWLAIGPGPSTIKTLPANFPTDIPLYDKENIEQITFISGRYKSRGVEVAALFPKIILAPLLLRLNQDGAAPGSGPSAISQTSYLTRVWRLVTTPVSDKRDSIQIEWKNLDAEPSFILSYYQKELRKVGYTTEETKDGTTKKILFSNARGIDGSFYVLGDEENHPGTDYAALTVNLSPPPPTSP